MNLLQQAKQYALLCQAKGLIPPPHMVQRLVDITIGARANKLLRHLITNWGILVKTPEEQARAISLQQELQTYRTLIGTAFFSSSPAADTAYIAFNFNDWQIPYTFSRMYVPTSEQISQLLKNRDQKEGVILEIEYTNQSEHDAQWNGQDFVLKLFERMPELNELKDLERAASKMNDFRTITNISVEHELIHMVQDIGAIIKDTPQIIGLPNKKVRERGADPYGQELIDNEWHPIIPHAERDVEFYTNLNDAINLFNHYSKGMNEETKKLFLKIFIAAGNENDQKRLLSIIGKWPKLLRPWNGVYWWFGTILGTERWKLAVKIFLEKVGL